MRNRDFQSNKGKFYLDFHIDVAASAVVPDILHVQKDQNLKKIYIKSTESRYTLVNEGFTPGSRTVQVFATTPYSAGTDSSQEKAVHVSVKEISLSKKKTAA